MGERVGLGTDSQLGAAEYAALRDYSPGLCRRLVAVMGLAPGGHVLEVGCGPGKHTVLTAGLAGCRATGVDLAPDRLERARRANPVARWVLADAHRLPFDTGAFTGAQTVLACQRFDRPVEVYAEVYRVLAPGARFAVVTLSHDQLAARPDLSHFPAALAREQRRFPAIETVAGALEEAGFVNVAAEPYAEPWQPFDTDYLRWVAARPLCALRELPDPDFVEGLERLRARLGASESPAVVFNEATIVCGTKGGRNE